MKLIRKEYHIIETFSEVEISYDDFERLSKLEDNDSFEERIYELFNNFQVIVSGDYSNELEIVDFKLPEQSESLGGFTIIDDNDNQRIFGCDMYRLDALLNNSSILTFLDPSTMKTFYWDYSEIKKFENIKQCLRDIKIDDILK